MSSGAPRWAVLLGARLLPRRPLPIAIAKHDSIDIRRVRDVVAPWLGPLLAGAGISLLCLRSIGGGGYLVQVDAIFGPVTPPLAQGLGAPVGVLLRCLAWAVGWGAAGRFYVVAALALAIALPMLLFPNLPWYARAAVGILGGLNPFVYDRLIEGQWGVVVAAALLFGCLRALESMWSGAGRAPAATLALCGAIAASFSPNFIPMIMVLGIAGLLAQHRWRDRRVVSWSLAAFLGTCLLLSPGLIGFFSGDGPTTYRMVQHVGAPDFTLFATSTSRDFSFLNLLGLYGYWAERVGRFPPASAGWILWPLSTLLLTAGAVAGAWVSPTRRWLLGVGVLGLAVSASTALPGGVGVATALVRVIPLAGAAREPGKWSALWLLALVVLNGEFLGAVSARWRTRRRLLPVLAVGGVLLATMLPAGVVQLVELPRVVKPVDYPADWYAAAGALDRGGGADALVVVLPWHLYQTLGFTGGRLIANPAPVFFHGRLISSNNPEIPGQQAEISSLNDIGKIALEDDHGGCALANAIRLSGAHHVVIEPAPGGEANATSLQGCGFRVIAGGPGEVRVLAD